MELSPELVCSVTYETLLDAICSATYETLLGVISDFACLIGLFQACCVCVTSGALSGTNASTTGLIT